MTFSSTYLTFRSNQMAQLMPSGSINFPDTLEKLEQ
jgi:hypothetical protein